MQGATCALLNCTGGDAVGPRVVRDGFLESEPVLSRAPEECPAPLVPAGVDLRDFGFMPLEVATLLSSSLWVKAKRDPRIGHAALSLWCKAWHEVPAGSLPDDDELLADYAGCDPEEWARIKARALGKFIRCSDGRLYHELVAKKALEAWAMKQARMARTSAALAARTKRKTEAERDNKRDVARDNKRDVERDVHQGTGTGTGTGTVPVPDGTGINTPTPEGVGSGSARKRAAPPPAPFRGEADLERLNGKAIVPLDVAWELPTAWGTDAEALGWKPREVLREAERFRQYWTDGKGGGKRRGVKGWRQAWGNWLAKAERMQR